MATLAGIAAGALLGVGGAGAAAQAVTAGSIAASQSVVLAYSRENEIQADQFGLKFLNQAGYNGKGLLKTLKKIRAKQWYGPDQVPTYLMTHPAVEDRIAYIDRWLTNKGQSDGVLPEVPATEFERIHTRIFTRFGDEQTVRQTFKNELAKHPDDPMAHYRYALILARVGQRQEAIGHMRTALSQRAFDPYLLNDLGRIYYLDGQFNEALNVLKTVAGMLPDDPECLFYLGRTYLEMNNLQAASATFYTLIDKHPNFAQAHYFLGQSLGKQNKLAEAHYQLGIYQHLEGDLRAAKMQFERALKNTPEANLKQRIQEELERIEALKAKDEPS
jgi:predicted Zn-dependent protease